MATKFKNPTSFFGFHVQKRAKEIIAKHVNYLKKHEPVGCRDRGTMSFLNDLGVHAELSLCATLTFPRRPNGLGDSIYLVEVPAEQIRSLPRGNHVVKEVSHRFLDIAPHSRLAYAQEVLATYRDKAALVITSRIHCAMPCAAMGIPVTFVGKRTYRTEVVEEVGIEMRSARKTHFLGREAVSSWPKILSFEEKKAQLVRKLKDGVARALMT